MDNCFLRNPVKVVVYDPVKRANLHTFVFIGDVPKNVKSVILADKWTKGHESTLREYFGSSWKAKLGINQPSPMSITKGGANSKRKDKYSDEELNIWSVLEAPPKKGGNMADLSPPEDVPADEIFSRRYTELTGKRLKTEMDDIVIDEADLLLDSEEPIKSQQLVTAVDVVDLSVKFGDKPVTYVTDIHIFPEDKVSELKEKIYVATNIPAYRQHIFWSEQMRITTPYSIFSEGLYIADIKDSFSEQTLAEHRHKVLNIPVDKALYENRDEIRVEARDKLIIIGNLRDNNNTFYITDIAQFIDPVRTQLNEIINDSYQFELFYYGFIIKFWPQMTAEVFYDYIISELDLYQKYPDLARSKKYLKDMFGAEAKILDKNYKIMNKIMSLMRSKYISIAVTNMMVTTNTMSKFPINIRNLFDKLRVSKCHPQIHAYVEHDGRKYMLKKRHVRNQSDILFPSNLRQGLILAISLRKSDQENFHKKLAISTIENEQSRYLFLNVLPNGKYYVKSVWNEEDGRTFDEVLGIIKRFIDPIIHEINSMGKYIFPGTSVNRLPILTKTNIYYHSLNVCMFWKRLMSESTFKFLKLLWEPYISAGIISSRGIQQSSVYEFMFHKGVVEFDLNIIERVLSAANLETMKNYYAHLSNNTLKQKWEQLYSGRVVRMNHRTTDIKFEVMNAREQEFQIFYRYVIAFISGAMCNEQLRAIATSRAFMLDSRKIKKLKKLRETDPELYNLKKYGSKKVYSILCQSPRQPMIYTDDEISAMTEAEKKKLVKYWNFTLNRPAYYGCPSKKYPHLSFLVGVHPKNYCLPCCGISAATDASKKTMINKVCLSNHVFVESDFAKFKELDEMPRSRHIMNYGKEIDVGRLSKLPNSAVKNLLYNSLEDEDLNYYVYGVPQMFPSAENSGILYCIGEALNIHPGEVVRRLLDDIRKNKKMFSTLLNGALIEIFRDADDFIESLREIFVEGKIVDFYKIVRFQQWDDLFIELAMLLMNIYTFIFIDETGRGDTTDLFITDALKSEILYLASAAGTDNVNAFAENPPISAAEKAINYLIVIKKVDKYYPLFALNPEKYFKTNEIEKKLFKRDDAIVRYLYSIVTSTIKRTTEANKPININILKEFTMSRKNYTIELKFINSRNMCYAAILTEVPGGSKIYVGLDYSAHISDGIPVTFDPFSPKKYSGIKLSSLEKFMGEFNKYLEKNHCLGDCGVKDSIYRYSLLKITKYIKYGEEIVGGYVGNIPYYFDQIDSTIKEGAPIETFMYDFEAINRAIIERKDPAEDNRMKKLGESLYKNYLYNLFVLEFINYIEKERNTEIRATLKKLICDTNFRKELDVFQKKLKELLEKFPEDLATIRGQLSDFYSTHFDKKQLINTIEGNIYEFDKITMNKLKNMRKSELIKELRELVSEFAVEKPIERDNISFPNIYLPCEHESNDYCLRGKLIVDENLDKLTEILATDILNPLKEKYMFSGMFTENIINFFNFDVKSSEVVTVIKM